MTADFDLEAYADSKKGEAAFQMEVIKEAHRCGWLVEHYRPSKVGTRYITHILGDSGGTDLKLARAGMVLFVEVKAQRGVLSPEQIAWRDAIGAKHWRCWRPSNKRAAWEELA